MKRLLPILLMLAACGQPSRHEPIDVSVIGPRPTLADPNRVPLTASAAVLAQATGQGLVRFDGSGQIEPGLAIRWDVSDDGLFYTFRLAPDSPIEAAAVVRRLRAAIAASGNNPLRHILGAIDEAVAVTDEIVELRLIAPRPDLLSLLAQPGLALDAPNGRTGPFRAEGVGSQLVRLTPRTPDDPGDAPDPADEVRLRGEPAAMAVARFAAGNVGLVTGGTFADVAIGRLGDRRNRLLRFDPAPGLFGLGFAGSGDFLTDPAIRRALSMAVDRYRLMGAFAVDGWAASPALLRGASDVPSPAMPDWAATPIAARRAEARAAILAWAETSGETIPTLTIALPDGPGARMLFALLRQDFAAVGVGLDRTRSAPDADLRLIDEVAPGGSAAWFLRHFTCDRAKACSEDADAEIAAARAALSLEQRSIHFAEANRLLEAVTPFIPIATPLRWMLVAPGLDGVRENPRAAHPLNHLRAKR